MSIKNFISKKTEKIRYKSIFFGVKYLTPVLYRAINIYDIPCTIRPSIKFIKERFLNDLIIGAEIGVQRGIHSENILKELNIKKLYLIDIWKNYSEHTTVYSKYNYDLVKRKFENDKRVVIMKGFSKNIVNDIKDSSLDFVYIDANHSYEYAYQDICLWFPKVKDGGVIAGHDIYMESVLKAVKEFCFKKIIIFQTEIPDWYFVK